MSVYNLSSEDRRRIVELWNEHVALRRKAQTLRAQYEDAAEKARETDSGAIAARMGLTVKDVFIVLQGAPEAATFKVRRRRRRRVFG